MLILSFISSVRLWFVSTVGAGSFSSVDGIGATIAPEIPPAPPLLLPLSSPTAAHSPQSLEQDEQVSPLLHELSPQYADASNVYSFAPMSQPVSYGLGLLWRSSHTGIFAPELYAGLD